MTPSRPAEGTTQDLAAKLREYADRSTGYIYEHEVAVLRAAAARLDTQERERINLLEQRDHLQNSIGSYVVRTERLRDGLRRLEPYAQQAEMRWMSVEDATIEIPARVVAEATRSLLASSSPQPGEGTAA